MRCQICAKLTLHTFCKSCKELLKPTPRKTTIDNLNIISFYEYDEIEKLLKFKYHNFGDKILNEVAKLSFKEFFKTFNYEKELTIIPIDDNPNNFSHTAILAKNCKSKNIKISYSTLHARTKVQYAGKDLLFRKTHPKNFQLLKKISNDVILVDDIVTTGTTLLEARNLLKQKGVEVLFALTLSMVEK